MSRQNQNEVVNADLAKERQSATIDVKSMQDFLGELTYMTKDCYEKNIKYREMSKIFFKK
jgi:hypothetical protein